MKIKTGDSVVVISGKDKGKTGTVLRVLPNKGRLVVAGINMRTKHVKATPQNAGQKIQYEASLNSSNVMLVDPKSKKRTRIGYRDEKGTKVRFAKNSGEVVKRTAVKEADEKVETKAKESKAEVKKETKKEAPKAAEKKTEAPAEEAKPAPKTPFWKRMGFGSSAQAEVEQDTSSGREDSTPPETSQTPDVRSHQRGN